MRLYKKVSFAEVIITETCAPHDTSAPVIHRLRIWQDGQL
jgi:hypothetical protein